jgi:hypothetical protein
MPKNPAAGTGNDGASYSLPELDGLTADQLGEHLADVNGRLDTILAKRDPADLPTLGELRTARQTIMAQQGKVAAAQAEIDAQFDEIAAEMAEPAADADAEVVEGELIDANGTAQAPAAAPAAAAPATPQLVTASGRPAGGAVTASRETGGLSGGANRLNPSLSGARAAAPAVEAPSLDELVMTASAHSGAAKLNMGDRIGGIRQLGDLVEDRARGMADAQGFRQAAPGNTAFQHQARRHDAPYGGTMVASIQNKFDTVLHDKSSTEAVQAYVDKLSAQRSGSAFESLVAAGGWCAPSQIRYDFFNIAGQSGMIDLPTFGVERGGIQYPISPSLADTFSPALPWYTAFSNATVPWLWTEGDDILAVTGSPTKPCIRVPCSTMDNRRLECYGICLTAGNLADNAWPESTANFIKLLMSAHYHASNARYISTIAGMAVANAGCTATGSGAAAPLLSTAELSAIDYRAKYGMARTDVIEWVLPEWALGLVRADLAKRTGVGDFMRIPDSEIAAWFDVRGIRAQFVQDYQVRAAGQPGASTTGGITQYPSTLKGLMYAAGTVARGNGMNLDLGVVRDSTLNARNDFTALWMEECHLIAKFGHEVREYTVNVCPDGTTGAADLTSCCP